MKPFEIFRTGSHTSTNGITKDYTAEDLRNIADTYNNSEHEAPIVIGHPKSNAPAYGWIEKLFVEGDRLFAQAKNLVSEFVDAVKEKKFLKRSISLTKDGLLNHVGFLGATVPAVKGLADIEFNDEQELTNFEFDKEMLSDGLNEEISLSDPSGEQDEESVLHEDEAQSTETEKTDVQKFGAPFATSRRGEATDGGTEIREYFENLSNTLTTVINDFKNVVSSHSQSNLQFMEENKEEIEKLHNKMSDLRAKIDVSNFELMLTEKVAYGSLTPAMKEKIVAILNYFETLNFAETDQHTLSSDLQNLLTEFVNSVPKIIQLEDVATKPEAAETKDDSFDDYELDPESAALHETIVKTMKQNELSYEEAFHKVLNEK